MPRPKISKRTASKESFEVFCAKHPEITITFEQYKKILYTYNNLLAIYLLETGNAIKLPFGLGILAINKYKPKKVKITKEGEEWVGLPVDWNETKKQGKKVFHLNHHTEGYKFHWMWLSNESKIKTSEIWKFEIARVYSRLLKNYLKRPNSKYKDIYPEYFRRSYTVKK